jgi:hypothetical protein
MIVENATYGFKIVAVAKTLSKVQSAKFRSAKRKVQSKVQRIRPIWDIEDAPRTLLRQFEW